MTHPLQLSPDYVYIEKSVEIIKKNVEIPRHEKLGAFASKIISKENAQESLDILHKKGISLVDPEAKEVFEELYLEQNLNRFEIGAILDMREYAVSYRIRKYKLKKRAYTSKRKKVAKKVKET